MEDHIHVPESLLCFDVIACLNVAQHPDLQSSCAVHQHHHHRV